MGNLLEQPFDDIWMGRGYQRFRHGLLSSRYRHAMCRDCSEGVNELFPQTLDYRSE
jgi:hypothetical protein